jgi:uncharacterized protein (TIGR03118 family)
VAGILYVTFANQNSPNGIGGLVDEFKTDGTFIKRLIDNSKATTPHGNLDLPWGVALAPASFGKFCGDLLVRNNGGDGWINAYDPISAAFIGSLVLNTGNFFHEHNLWALSFGKAASGDEANTLYFIVGLDATGDEGLFGSISAVPEPGSMLLVGIGASVITVHQFRRRRKARLAVATTAC